MTKRQRLDFNSEELNVTNTQETITLKPGEYRMFSTVQLSDPRGGTSADDSDGDRITDDIDLCPNSFPGAAVDEFGWDLFSLPADNFSIEVTSETCPTKENGIIEIKANTLENYKVTIDERTCICFVRQEQGATELHLLLI